ncbi:SUKH-4 family immunity protein [Streptomyces sp. GS7]|uniref:SUKH-4 family immunity protein n=1 Tax=Streptomyces sp. GS7 TaxID=2692234 RepID=UPI00131706F8|nr:SUKH-4 family immunity protein [Streptomyces sp. GS7]QHC20973.1 hypothetical protein GR130_05535 [Streptomyces sp. GS7]
MEQDGLAVEAVLREVHRGVPGSVLLDATGKTAEELLRELLDELGVLQNVHFSFEWGDEIRKLGQEYLVLISHAEAAGPTRRSAQPELVRQRLVGRIGLTRGVSPVVAVPTDHKRRSGALVLRLASPPEEGPSVPASTALPVPVQALAFSEPRQVPLAVWRELITAATVAGLTAPASDAGPPADDAELSSLAQQFTDHLRYTDGHVSFLDEGTADAIRRAHGPELPGAVGRHMVTWLRERTADFRHPDGWAASGSIGRYAAEGIAMHAVQANLFDELLADGTVVAHLPQRSLLDAAHCAHNGSLQGNNAAADAVHLQMYGLTHTDQATWAAWLHLMATARNDTAFADAIEHSGIQLPWQTLWTHWRPPGGYHHTYLRPGPIDDLYAVRWQGRPAVLSYGSLGRSDVYLWDLASGELLAGPWEPDEEFPAEARDSLTWGPDTAPASGPASPRELRQQLGPSEGWEGALEGPLYVYLDADPAVSGASAAPIALFVLAGTGGLFAVQPQPGVDITALQQPRIELLLGSNTAAGAASPAGAPGPSPHDLADMYGAEAYVATAAEDLPEGLTDPAARRVLTGTGLPEIDDQGLALQPSQEGYLREVHWPEDHPEQPDETGPFFGIGMWMGGYVVVDGPTGRVLRCPGDIDDPTAEGGVLVATGLDNFLTMAALFITGLRTMADVDNDDETHLLRQHVEGELWAVDPEGSGAGAWTYPLHNE